MCFRDYHVHTTFSDGENTPEEAVLAAIKLGMSEIGFSDHSYISRPYGTVYWMSKSGEEEYKKEIARLKAKYKDRIKILCGIEQDYCSDHPAEGFDYIIGSVHFIETEDGFFPVDESESDTLAALKCFDGDIYSFTEEYYKRVANVVEKTKCDIIGHFDLVSKFNERAHLFDEQNPRYKKAWRAAADALIKTGKPFEINMGGIISGIKTSPYPSGEIYDHIKKRGGKFILSSDAHAKKHLCFNFEKYGDI